MAHSLPALFQKAVVCSQCGENMCGDITQNDSFLATNFVIPFCQQRCLNAALLVCAVCWTSWKRAFSPSHVYTCFVVCLSTKRMGACVLNKTSFWISTGLQPTKSLGGASGLLPQRILGRVWVTMKLRLAHQPRWHKTMSLRLRRLITISKWGRLTKPHSYVEFKSDLSFLS